MDNSPDKLIAVATRLFSRQGYDGTSVKELAEAAGVNISLVSYHFGGKEGLLKACLHKFGKERLEVAQKLAQFNPKQIPSREEFRVKLTLIAQEVLRCHTEETDLMQLLHRTVELHPEMVREIFAETFAKSLELIAKFFEYGQKHKVMRGDVNPLVAAQLFMGNLIHLGCKAQPLKDFGVMDLFSKKDQDMVIQNWLRIYLEGAFAPLAQTSEGNPS